MVNEVARDARIHASDVDPPYSLTLAEEALGGHRMRPARVAVAHIEAPNTTSLAGGLAYALIPGHPVTRFGRTWRIEVDRQTRNILTAARTAESISDLPAPEVSGRLGYDKSTGSAPAWDEKAERFVETEQHDGDVVPFLIRLSDLSVAFQRTSKIRRQSFIGALQGILRSASENDGWKVEDRVTRLSWRRFQSTVDRVTEITIVVKPTNPGWDGQGLFEPYIDDVGADVAKINMKGDDLDTDAEPVQQARVHAIERDYGELVVKGKNADGVDMRFDSSEQVPLLDTDAERTVDGLVGPDALREALSEADEIRASLPDEEADTEPDEDGDDEDGDDEAE